MNLILIAPPAAGKGTLAEMLNDKYGLVCISAGELLRGVNPETELGKMIRDLQSRRELIEDGLVNDLIEERLSCEDAKKGFILDGYPRHMPQVSLIESTLEKLNLKVDYAVVLKVDYELALKRTLGRRICPKCKKSYNELTLVNNPKVSGICDECGEALVSRNDDNEETFKLGFDLYNEISLPVIEYYRSKNMIIEVDANGSAQETFENFERAIGKLND